MKSCLIHKYIEIENTGKHSYQECSKCRKRKIVVLFDTGYQPINRRWLNEIKDNIKEGEE